jgi:hypothetical protein
LHNIRPPCPASAQIDQREILFFADNRLSARDKVIASIASGETTLLQLVEISGEYLTNTDNGIRNRGTRLLSDVLSTVNSLPMPTAQLRSLLIFFGDRSEA